MVAPTASNGTKPTDAGAARNETGSYRTRYDAATTTRNSDGVVEHSCRDRLWVGDARHMDTVGDIADNSVALVVTSPPYFAGKEYEAVLGQGHVPADYLTFLDMLEAVFTECVRKLAPSGRIAVNVANLGRRPYRSLSTDVIQILQNRLGLCLCGEVIWVKARGAAGSCAWGSFRQPSNPVLRDLTERVVIAAKRLPDDDEVVAAAATDIWEIAAASATRVGHPAPFPVELPKRLIEQNTSPGDLVLDPFMGAGTTALAALQTGRHYVGFDTDVAYIDTANKRIAKQQTNEQNGC